ncbi:MAG: hypothetical protein ACI4U3_09210 [Traorella sp.]
MLISERYTDEYYASNYEIKEYFHIGSHIVLDDINKYRNQFRIYFYYQNQKISLVITNKIKFLLQSFYPHHDIQEIHPYIQLFILRNDKETCQQCLLFYHLPIEILSTFSYVYSFEEDITKSFLEWLEHLQTKPFIKMIQYAHKIQTLSLKQRQFFYENTSFTIEEYQQALQLSYETARLHLKKFDHKQIIRRHKIGKKYVFKVNHD